MLLRSARGPRRVRALIALGVIAGLAIAVTGVTTLVLPSRALAAQSTLTVLSGTVEVRAAGDADFS